MWRSSVALGVALGGCGTFSMDYRPANAEQRIGADLLASAPVIWRCEGGERIGLVEDGRGLFVASQDLLVRDRVAGLAGTVFRYTRPHRETLKESALTVSYVLPEEPGGNLLVLYATETITDLSHKAGCAVPDARYANSCAAWYATTSTKVAMLPLRTDSCWRERPGTDTAGEIARLYSGAVPYRGDPPAGARHLQQGMCTFNENNDPVARSNAARRGQAWELVTLNRAFLGAEDTVLVPQDVYVTDGAPGRVIMMRPDRTGIELTTPAVIDGESGWLFERAGRPVFVNVTPGRRAFYVYPPSTARPPDPARLERWYVQCWYGDGA